MLRREVAVLKAGMNRQQRDSIQYNIYQREADANRELYNGLLQRYKEIGVASVGASNISIVDLAKYSSSKPSDLCNFVVSDSAESMNGLPSW